jgi:hypothetical protein
MATRNIIIKNSSVPSKVPTTDNINIAELAINLADKRIYTRDANDNIISLNVTPDELQAVLDIANSRIASSEKGTADGVATLDSGGKIPSTQLPDSVLGQVEYQGAWNASTNTPALTVTPVEKGHYYVVSVAGTFNSVDYGVGDWIVSNGTVWEKIDNTDAVTSVNGRLGAIVLDATDVGLGNVDNTADIDKPISTATETALSGKVSTSDSRLTDSREWTAETVTQVTAEAGTDTTRTAWTAQRVRQAINAGIELFRTATTTLSGLMSSSDKTKLDGIETGAQVNVGTDITVTQSATEITIESSTGGLGADIAPVTDLIAGPMTPTDKVKLDGIESGAEVNPATTDSRVSTSTTDVLQAKAMSDHVASDDHDTRYYTKAEIDAMFAALNP